MITDNDVRQCRLQTIRDVIRYAMTQFEINNIFCGHGCADTYEEAYFLVLRSLKLNFEDSDRFWDARVSNDELKMLLERIQKRAVEKIPTPYLLKEAWLTEHPFYCDERVIIPRSYIAELLKDELAPWVANPDNVTRVLDLCTGSGCLGILAAEVFPNAKVDCVDISADALDVARINVQRYGMQDRIELIQSDLYNNLGDRQYDVIISNPPYVTQKAMDELPMEYRHEPALALGAGNDGLDIVRRLMTDSKAHLTNKGVIVVEVGDGKEACEAAYPKVPFTWLATEEEDAMVYLLRKDELQPIPVNAWVLWATTAAENPAFWRPSWAKFRLKPVKSPRLTFNTLGTSRRISTRWMRWRSTGCSLVTHRLWLLKKPSKKPPMIWQLRRLWLRLLNSMKAPSPPRPKSFFTA